MFSRQGDARREGHVSYWGKARSQLHLLPFHCLDVAAVAEAWLEASPDFEKQMTQSLGHPLETLRPWLLWIVALHDLGKFAVTFQARVPWAFEQLQGPVPWVPALNFRHDALGVPAFWRWVAPTIPGVEEDGWNPSLRSWAPLLSAATHHHGRPIPGTGQPKDDQLDIAFRPRDREALVAFSTELQSLFGLQGTPPSLPEANALRASSWIAGVVVLADWIGSQETWFPPNPNARDLHGYWTETRARAKQALRASGILPSAPAKFAGFRSLFPKLTSATPLQTLVEEIPLKPGLFILESLTGDGKTEAAVILLHRLMAEGHGDGFYVGLPTMATANAMYSRLRDVFPKLFECPEATSFILAHGARDLVTDFRVSVLPVGSSGKAIPEEESTAEARCAAWLADRSKKALLAQGGVGTLDQALLAVLQAKHQSLRLLGLFRKVLVVDEVHANDPYMHRVLQELLRFHAAAGGSAILLSATLPMRMRQELAGAFSDGAGWAVPHLNGNAYPLVTALSADGSTEKPFEIQERKRRRVLVRRLNSEAEVLEFLLATARSGRCACWIRNTVGEAMEAFQSLQAMAPDPSRVLLFHARFTLGDRLEREQEVLATFGPKSDAATRQGRILVATQVVEQSLDLDFDELVSDPAPIDLVIQRAGRLCRHPRDPQGNPLPQGQPNQRSEACLSLLAPDPFDSITKNWMECFSRGTSFVYPDTAVLLRTLKTLLVGDATFHMPEDGRALVEAVFGEEAEPAPQSLQRKEADALGKAMADASTAMANTLDLRTGYQALGVTWLPDAIVPTRLGESSITLRLARWENGLLSPWRQQDDAFAWELSEIRVREAQVKSVILPEAGPLAQALEALNNTLPDQGRWSPVLPLRQDSEGCWWAEVLDGRGRTRKAVYDPSLGLQFLSLSPPL